MMQINAEEREIVELVARFVDRAVRPVARDLEHANTYPAALIEQMKQLGVYGLVIPAPYGDFAVSMACYSLITEELARGWMSLAGAFGGHSVVASLLVRFGTEDQRARYLPRLATGELRATMALTEPDGGSDLQALRTHARTATPTSSTARRRGSRMHAIPASLRSCAKPTPRPFRRTRGSASCSSRRSPDSRWRAIFPNSATAASRAVSSTSMTAWYRPTRSSAARPARVSRR